MQVFSRNNKTVVTINGKTRTYNGNVSIINGKIISEDESIDIAELSTEKQITVNITGDVKEISGVFSVNVNGNVEGNINSGNNTSVVGNVQGNINSGNNTTVTENCAGDITSGINTKVGSNQRMKL